MSYNRPRGERSLLIERILRIEGTPMAPVDVAVWVAWHDNDNKPWESLRDSVTKKLGQMANSKDIPVRKTGPGLYAYDKSAVIGR